MNKLLLLIMTVFIVSCGSKYIPSSPLPIGTLQCSADMEGENVYRGFINDNYSEGEVVLALNEMGGIDQNSKRVTATAFVYINGTQLCCRTDGTAYIYNSGSLTSDDYAAVRDMRLVCSSQTGSYGYSQLILTLGTACGGSNGFEEMYLTMHKSMEGCFVLRGTVNNPAIPYTEKNIFVD